jgi:hypothetical protein
MKVPDVPVVPAVPSVRRRYVIVACSVYQSGTIHEHEHELFQSESGAGMMSPQRLQVRKSMLSKKRR